ncbi:hypothetical protein [Hyphococcus sp.]|uniref:hypothetical protein n=1 Tax=Hyphococcus sp. TaxID=2038636 RepID=UPI0037521E0C
MFQALLRILPLMRPTLAAKLAGVNGFTGRGAIAYSAAKSGVKTLSVKLDGLAGRGAEILADETHAVQIKIRNGHADETFVSKKGHRVPDLKEGDRIDVQQNGDVILSGVLTRN